MGKRGAVVAVAMLAAVLIPLAALGSSNDWWFFSSGGTPEPTRPPRVVKEGEWDGHAWQLIAYPSRIDGLCFSITPPESTRIGEGGALSCTPFAGVPRTRTTKSTPDLTITALLASAMPDLPPYIAGPVIDRAAVVEVRFANDHVLRLPTFRAPPPLQRVRFFAAQVPERWVPRTPGPRYFAALEWVAGLDRDGNVVACLAPKKARDGISPLSDCR
jgi:hypothetical protein